MGVQQVIRRNLIMPGCFVTGPVVSVGVIEEAFRELFS
jgi:hypothetical protein